MTFRIYSTLPGRLLALACIAVPLSGLSAAALAQTAAQTANPAVLPAFRSAFEGYQPYTDEKMVDWKQANDKVGEIGGWREYAKEASRAEASGNPEPGSTPAAQPANPDPKASGAQAKPQTGSGKP